MAKQKIRVSSITEVDVKDVITAEIEKAVKTIVDNCTKEYKRDIDVAFTVNVK